MTATPSLPSIFETLAGIVKFIAVPKMSPDFHHRHEHAVNFACSFLSVMASSYPPVEVSFRRALPISIRDGAVFIEAGLREANLSEEKLHWFDRQTTEVLKLLVPVVSDPDLPGYLHESKWAVVGAFVG